MSIKLNTGCLQCHMGRALSTARSLGNEDTAMAFARELMQLYIHTPPEASSPNLGPLTDALLRKYYPMKPDRYQQEKEDSNRFVLERMDQLRDMIRSAPDPLFAAIQFSILGNYLDFAALQDKVSFEELEKMLAQALDMQLDQQVYGALKKDLEQGGTLLYLTDNAGEIGFDRLLAEEIHRYYPALHITFCVRGSIVHNDATREDAQVVGIPFPVMDNGSNIGGTDLSAISPEAKKAMEEADVLIAKGMGNTETLFGCGLNIYYAFLVKCAHFERFFEKPLMTPMLVRDPNFGK